MGINSVDKSSLWGNGYSNNNNSQLAYQHVEKNPFVDKYHQGRYEVNPFGANSQRTAEAQNPYSNRSVFENLEDLNTRTTEGVKYTAQLNAKSNPNTSLWDGFSVQANNGTGELIPKVDGKYWFA